MMSFGGNGRARAFFKQHGWTDGGGKIEAKYTSRAAELYRQLLSKEIAKSVVTGTAAPLATQPTAVSNAAAAPIDTSSAAAPPTTTTSAAPRPGATVGRKPTALAKKSSSSAKPAGLGVKKLASKVCWDLLGVKKLASMVCWDLLGCLGVVTKCTRQAGHCCARGWTKEKLASTGNMEHVAGNMSGPSDVPLQQSRLTPVEGSATLLLRSLKVGGARASARLLLSQAIGHGSILQQQQPGLPSGHLHLVLQSCLGCRWWGNAGPALIPLPLLAFFLLPAQ